MIASVSGVTRCIAGTNCRMYAFTVQDAMTATDSASCIAEIRLWLSARPAAAI